MQNLDAGNITKKNNSIKQGWSQKGAQSVNNQHWEAREQGNRGERKDGWKIWGCGRIYSRVWGNH